MPTTHLRVHIAFVGHDVQRVTEPLIKQHADIAYIFGGGPSPTHAQRLQQVEEIASGPTMKHITIHKRTSYPWSLDEVLAEYAKIILPHQRQGDVIFINVSSGTKVSAMAGLLASMLWGAQPYYVPVVGTSTLADGKIVESVGEPLWPPVLRLPDLTKDDRTTLEFLSGAGDGAKKEDIIAHLVKHHVIKGDIAAPAQYRALERILSRPSLTAYVKVAGKFRAARIELTEYGRQAVQLLVNPVIAAHQAEEAARAEGKKRPSN